MDSITLKIINEYRDNKHIFERLYDAALMKLNSAIRESGVKGISVSGRIKTRESLEGKLARKFGKYASIFDITDIVGLRAVTIYGDEVDILAKYIEENFVIDRENTVDRRKHDINTFEYSSLHYICSLPHDPELSGMRFEIQVRSTLQHVWAMIDHGIFYKTDIMPPEFLIRRMNGLAGLLEIADDTFISIRNDIADYQKKVYEKISARQFSDLSLDGITFEAYMQNHPFAALEDRLLDEMGIDVEMMGASVCLAPLADLDFKTLGDIDNMINSCSDATYELISRELKGLDIDIISASTVIRSLMLIYMVQTHRSNEEIITFFRNNFKRLETDIPHLKKIISEISPPEL